ncbi:MAG: hypothetical protein V7746_17055 [Halioglobus sp.]
MLRQFIDSIPISGVLITTVLLVLIATEIGFRIGLIRSRRPDFQSEDHASSMTGAHLGLLAFILAFTFSMAAGHFDARKRVILEESNAIETAYLRTGLVTGPEATRLRGLLQDYADLRSRIAADSDPVKLVRESEEMHSKMWREVQAITATQPLTVMHSLLTQSINAVFEVHNNRVSAGLRNRIPPSIWVALYSVLVLSMLGMGYQFGIKGSRSPIPSAALALSFSMILYLIADLDRPTAGLVVPDQTALKEMSKRLAN